MSKIVFILELPEVIIRKKQAPPAKAHKKKNAYNRKAKHRKDWKKDSGYGEASGPKKTPAHNGSFFVAEREQLLRGRDQLSSCSMASRCKYAV